VILDPLSGILIFTPVTNLNLRGTIKELAQLDGGFVVSREGIVLSRAATSMPWAEQWTSAGTRQPSQAAANMSAVTKAVGIVVSESSVVGFSGHGELVGEIIPEVWMMDHAAHLRGTVKRTIRRTHDSDTKSATALSEVTNHNMRKRHMTTMQEFRCEICGLVTTNLIHWS